MPLTHVAYNDRENTCTWSYYHHEIGSMVHLPLIRVRSWNNGVRCMSFYIRMCKQSRTSQFHIDGVIDAIDLRTPRGRKLTTMTKCFQITLQHTTRFSALCTTNKYHRWNITLLILPFGVTNSVMSPCRLCRMAFMFMIMKRNDESPMCVCVHVCVHAICITPKLKVADLPLGN